MPPLEARPSLLTDLPGMRARVFSCWVGVGSRVAQRNVRVSHTLIRVTRQRPSTTVRCEKGEDSPLAETFLVLSFSSATG